MTNAPQLGSIIHGTQRPEDLIPAFAAELDDYDDETATELRAALETGQPSAMADALDGAFDALDTLCADCLPYCYFGAHEGDGSDFGYWVNWDALEDDVRDGIVLKVSDLSEVFGDYIGPVLHGNATLYSVTLTHNNTSHFRELWSVV